ncbi:MAG: 3-phenylpropionate/cinnamic acid dioxygenase subunit beta [Gammaproteobacteria bacterium]|nr:3-phenylpropionate/cinnamic acid dioxygenase subunit beta [Gammaproteobacteria bacterium]
MTSSTPSQLDGRDDRNDRIESLLLKDEVSEFLHQEADLLDERRFDEWLALLADDLIYVMPIRLNVSFADHDERSITRAGEETCWFDEGKRTLEKRVAQIRTGVHWAEEPFSRVSHLVSNIRIRAVRPSVPAVQEVDVSCRFLVYRNRVETETDFFVGRREDTLRRNGDSWLIAQRRLLLDQNVLLAKNLTVMF